MLFNSSQDGKSFSRERMPSVVNSYRFIRIMLYTCSHRDQHEPERVQNMLHRFPYYRQAEPTLGYGVPDLPGIAFRS